MYSRLRAGLPADADFQAAAGKPTTYIFPNRPATLSVLRAALQRDPTDATASFLLGSLYLSGGRVEPHSRPGPRRAARTRAFPVCTATSG